MVFALKLVIFSFGFKWIHSCTSDVFHVRLCFSFVARLESIDFYNSFAGGAFALYSLICRHAKTNTIPNQHPTDQALTTYSTAKFEKNSIAGKVKQWLEGNRYSQKLLVALVLLGTSMLIGDGILTPAISGIEIFVEISRIGCLQKFLYIP